MRRTGDLAVAEARSDVREARVERRSAFEDAAHVLKGSAATLGAARLRIAAYDLELRGRDHNLEHAGVHLTALEAAFKEALEALSQGEIADAALAHLFLPRQAGEEG